METLSALLALCERNPPATGGPVDSPHKEQRRGALVFPLICTWTNGWANNRDASDLRRNRANYDVTCLPVVGWWRGCFLDITYHLISELRPTSLTNMYPSFLRTPLVSDSLEINDDDCSKEKKLHWNMYGLQTKLYHWVDFRFAPSQGETSSQSNAVSHWLGANLDSSL